MRRKVPLPISSRQETLETISRNHLALLFNPDIYELRAETQRDKGIDIIGEIKQNGLYTNFRFAVQLKSTESTKKNRDGSLSFPVEISNLNYLLSFGLPGFYILYNYPENQFYTISAKEVYRNLTKKFFPAQLPKTYKVKFTEPLDQTMIDAIYKETFEHGSLLKKLNAHINFQIGDDKLTNGFLVDEQQDVYSVEQNIEFIGKFGFQMLNQHAFAQIIEIEKRTHPRDVVSPTFNMICGLAYYHQGDLFKGIELMKVARKEIDTLHPEDQAILLYSLVHAKYLIGLVSERDLKKETEQIIANENAGTFLQLEYLFNRFLEANEVDERTRIQVYYDGAMEILADHRDFHDMRVVAYAKILGLESTLILHELSKNLFITMGRKKDAYRELVMKDWSQLAGQFQEQLTKLFRYAQEHQNYLAMSNLAMDKIDWDFTKLYYIHAFNNWERDTQLITPEVSVDDKLLLAELLKNVKEIVGTYDKLQHRENQFSCLKCKYEILIFLGNKEEAASCAEEMGHLIEAYEMNALRNSLRQMLDGNLKSQIFIADLAKRRASFDLFAKNCDMYEHLYEDVTEEMIELLGQKPKWSYTELPILIYPEKQ